MPGPGLTGPRNSIAQVGAVLIGVPYLAIGVIGFFFTGFDGFVQNGNDGLLGFDLNGFHNVIHLAVGAFLLLVARLDTTAAEGALIGGGLVYALAAFLGFENRLQIISINDVLAPDNFLHVVSALAVLGFGLASTLASSRMERSGDAIQQA